MFKNQQETHRVRAQVHRYSTLGACLSACFIGTVSGGPGGYDGRSSSKKYHGDFSHRLFSGHTRLYNQDNSAVDQLTSADVDKAGKKKDMKQHKQVVNSRLNNSDKCCLLGSLFVFQADFLCFS